LELVYEEQDRRLRELETQFRHSLESKESEVRRLKTEVDAVQKRYQIELGKQKDKLVLELQKVQERERRD
jgi:hypothetical protein